MIGSDWTNRIPFYDGPLPLISASQMIVVDRAMMADYGITLMQMMENAGRHLAHLARLRFLNGDARGKKVTVMAGTGGNGGGALVAARRLHNWGALVSVLLTRTRDEFVDMPRHQLESLQAMRVPIYMPAACDEIPPADVVLDGIIGYSLRGAPQGATAELIGWAAGQSAPILSLDTPSGLDVTSGIVHEPAIHATATLTLALPKTGLMRETVKQFVGELYLGDISVPPQLYGLPDVEVQVGPIFAQSDIVRLR